MRFFAISTLPGNTKLVSISFNLKGFIPTKLKNISLLIFSAPFFAVRFAFAAAKAIQTEKHQF